MQSTKQKTETLTKKLLVIGGPTAVGKTAVAVRLAQHFDCPILSADSRQFYREMNKGTAKPDAAEMNAAEHHFIDNLSIADSYSVGDYEREAIALSEEIFAEKDTAILVGGTGLYLRAVCEGLDDFPKIPDEINAQLEAELKADGLQKLVNELEEKDFEYHSTVDQKNPHRVLRALAVIRATGKPFSAFRTRKITPRPFTCLHIGLTADREVLYERINRRVDKMVENGLIEEARKLYPQRHLKSLQTVGYQEFFQHFAGEITEAEAVELVKRNSRRYAKRQMTWFRNQQPAGGKRHFFAADDFAGILRFIANFEVSDTDFY